MAGKALVLGGGGVTGIAWSLGLLAGLAEAGIDFTDADAVIGTSAGSAVGAQLTTRADLDQLYARELAGGGSEVAARLGRGQLLRFIWAAVRPGDSAKTRAKVGAMALATATVPEADRRSIIAARLPVHSWPDQRLIITAVDAASGAFATFDKDSGVPLVDAVAASCAVPGAWPPVSIDGRRYIDGGVRSITNVDLAAGYERVVVIAPMLAGSGAALRRLRRQARVVVVSPDKAARRAIGSNPLDPARRPPAARAGRAQAARTSAAIGPLWMDSPTGSGAAGTR
jgi:NTE family protein